MKKTIILILILISGLCSAANLVMLIGGDGDQTGTTYPCIADKQAFEDGEVTDFMDANGLPKVTVSSAALTYGATSSFIAGDFSDANNGAYAYVYFGVADPNNGYYDIEDSNSTALKIATTNIDNVAIDADDTVDVYIGGAGVNLASAVARMADIDLSLGHNVDVLTNKSESLGATTISLNSDLKGKIRFIGTIYDSSTANNNFAACAEKDDFPILNMGADALTITGAYLIFKNLYVTGTKTLSMWSVTGDGNVIDSCYIYNTGTGSTTRRALNLTEGGVVINSYIRCDGTYTSGAVLFLQKSSAYGCYIVSGGSNYGVIPEGGGSANNVLNCIIVGNGVANGIHLTLAYSTYSSYFIANNYIYNFATGVNIAAFGAITNYPPLIFNNVIWGTGASSYGIYNVDYATKSSPIFINNNFIGNCTGGESNFIQDISTVSLSTLPFKNGSGNMNEAKDFYLTDAAKLICKAKPSDFDLNGTDDNYQTAGAITEQVTSSGTSAGSISITEN